jgi:isocitrate/isopropylmalate dehydrogenase
MLLKKFKTPIPAHLLGLAMIVGVPYPDATHEICLAADAVLFGAGDIPNTIMTQLLRTPEQGLLLMRKSYCLLMSHFYIPIFN